MKRTNFILNGFLALAIVLVFAQCSDKNNNAATSSAAPAAGVLSTTIEQNVDANQPAQQNGLQSNQIPR